MSYSDHTHDRPVVGITLGDFNGVGPEIILKTLSDQRVAKLCIPVVYGQYKIFARYKKMLQIEEMSFHSIKHIGELFPKKNNLVTCWEEDFELQPGKVTAEAGKCAYLSLKRATDDILSGKLDAIVTAPINKKNIQNPDFSFVGHTEYLTQAAGIEDSLMFMVSEHMRIALATAHIPLQQVKHKLTPEWITNKLNLLHKSLKNDFAIPKPKIAVLGLNPHAGEDGLLGDEEINIIQPAVNEFKNKGYLVYGPFPADGFFASNVFRKYDAILAMYHDQGLIPFKLTSFDSGVNFTAGLPFVRTSPDHGTAYDVAGKGIASENSFRQALFLAIDLVKNKIQSSVAT
ncbi:MAG: 4-hydroxythreonine-4-phosphate dehydrogenase PdxA [Cytophagaceae bacterium]|nr:4-hydroxythreonine-4-phosphate dehydrogenase PdxA [Cytophagaceae bacterium]MDW8456458.1 4-hydroxythreonine-4-phosphate dehydrogenase PdxA [Cytophagaceae bacterium]